MKKMPPDEDMVRLSFLSLLFTLALIWTMYKLAQLLGALFLGM